MKFLLLCVATLWLFSGSLATPESLKGYSEEQLGKLLTQELSNRGKTKSVSPLYDSLIEHFRYAKKWKLVDDPKPRNTQECILCNSALTYYITEIHENGATYEQIAQHALELCLALNIQAERVCRGAIANNVQEVYYIVKNRPEITAELLCGVVFQSGCDLVDLSHFEWNVNVDPNKPELTGSKDTSVAPSASDLKIAHITDPHYDPNYLIGSWAACDESNCCRFDQPLPSGASSSEAAGRWGDYRDCDSPLDAVIDVLQEIRRRHDVDYVYFTGDIVDHAIWATTVAHNKGAITRINSLVRTMFGGVPVFPVLGNHESHPVNLFAPGSAPIQFSTQWLYDYIAQEWSPWLPESALETVRKGGYYTVAVRPGFRIVTINNNECYTMNWWLVYEPTFPRAQLQWLHDVLLEAERNNEKVHILSHIPPGSGDCFKIYAREYRRIVERFWNTISAQFCGHTHNDEFNIFYSRETPTQALNILWNGGSSTAFSDVNPNYKIFTMDTQTYQVNSHETWIYNLTQANLTPNQTPHWFREYDFKTEYNLPNLSPGALSTLPGSMAGNPELLKRYWELKHKLGDTSLEAGCDADCLAGHLCKLVTTEYGNSPQCQELLAIWNAQGK